MTTRSAIPADSDKIADLTARLGFSVDREAVRNRLTRLLDRADHSVCVAASEGEVIGWMHARAAVVMEIGYLVEIVSLVVAERFRRRGAGGSLVRRAERWAQELGAETILSRTDARRPEGHGFFPALGYALTATQAVYRKPLRLERDALRSGQI